MFIFTLIKILFLATYTNPRWHLPKRVQAGVASQEMFQEIEYLNHWGMRNIEFDSAMGDKKDTI